MLRQTTNVNWLGMCMFPSGTQPIPNNELALANDLYRSLQEFYKTHKQYKDRPLYITGEVSKPPSACSTAQHNAVGHDTTAANMYH